MSTSPMRRAFLERLKNRFFDRLSQEPIFSQWRPLQTWTLAESIINGKRAEINAYLDENKFPIKQAETVINKVIEKFLLPEIDKLTL